MCVDKITSLSYLSCTFVSCPTVMVPEDSLQPSVYSIWKASRGEHFCWYWYSPKFVPGGSRNFPILGLPQLGRSNYISFPQLKEKKYSSGYLTVNIINNKNHKTMALILFLLMTRRHCECEGRRMVNGWWREEGMISKVVRALLICNIIWWVGTGSR